MIKYDKINYKTSDMQSNANYCRPDTKTTEIDRQFALHI